MTDFLHFEVFADPAPQGSKSVVPTKAGWRTKESSEKKVKPFRAAVAAAAAEAFAGRPPFAGPVELDIVCYHARPANHFGTGRNAGVLKSSAPDWKTTAPDLSKVVRAAEDALQAIAFISDARVARLRAVKRYAPVGYAPRVLITVTSLTGEEVTNGFGSADPAPESEREARRGDLPDAPSQGGGAGGGEPQPGQGARDLDRDHRGGDRAAVADQGVLGEALV